MVLPYIKNGNNDYHSGYKVKPVDTTGAGDALLVQLLAGF